MVFDLSTAKPFEQEDTPFDINTARPVGSSSGLDNVTLEDINRKNQNPGNKEFFFVPGRNVNVELPRGGIDKAWNFLRRSYDSGKDSVELGNIGAGIVFGQTSPELEKRISALQKKTATPDPLLGILPTPQEGWVNYIADAITNQIPNLAGMFHDGMEAGAAAGIANMAMVPLAGPLAPAVGAAVPITTTAAFATGSLRFAFNQIAGSSYLEYRAFTDKDGNKLPDAYAKLGAVMSGAVGTGLEALPFTMLAKIMPGVSRIFNKAGVKAAEALKFPTTTQAMKTFLFNIAKVAVAEGLTEAAQEVVQIETGEALKAFTEGEFEPVSTEEMWARIQEAGLKGAIVGGGISIPIAGARAAVDIAKEAKITEPEKVGAPQIEIKEVVAVKEVTPKRIEETVEKVGEIISRGSAELETVESVEEVLAPLGPSQATRETLIKGRIQKLDTDIANIDKQIQTLDQQIVERKLARKTTTALEKRVDNLLNKRELLDVERESMLIIGLANDLKVSKKVTKEEQKRAKVEQKKAIDVREAELILEELEQGNEPERQFRTDEEGFIEEVFQVRSTNPPFLSGRTDLGGPDPLALNVVGLKQTEGKKPNRRSKKAVKNAVRRVIEGKPKPTDPPQAALHQRILDIIEDRLSGELSRFQPGTGIVDPIRANALQSLAELQAEEGVTTIQDIFNALEDVEQIREIPLDVSKPIEVKGEKIVKLEEQSLKAQERALAKGLRQGARTAKTDIKQAIKNIKQLIRSTSLPKDTKDAIIAQFVTGEQDFIQNIPRLKSKIASEFERLAIKEQKARINKALSAKAIKPRVVSGVKQGKFDAQIQEELNNLRTLNSASGKVNPDTGESEASLLLDDRIEKGIDDPLGNAILNLKANPRRVTSAELAELADKLDILTSEGREAAKARVLKRQIEAQQHADNIVQFVSKGENIKAIKTTGAGSVIKSSANFTRQLLARLTDGWDDILDRILPTKQAQQLEIGAEIQIEKGIKRRMSNNLTKAAEASFGIKDGRKLRNLLENSNEVKDYGIFINAKNEEVRIEMSVSQGRKLFMEWQDPTLRETLTSEDGNAYTQEMLTFVFNSILSEQDRQFALEQLSIYAEFYNEINEVYSRVFGINLDKNEFYSPIRREVDGQEIGLDEFGRDQGYRTKVANNPSLKIRQKNVQPILLRSDLSVYNRHVTAMSRFIALREKTQLLNNIFGKREVRRNLEAQYGRDFNLFVGEHLQSFVNGGNMAADVLSKIINELNRNFAAAQLGAKAKIGFTQLVSYFAYAETIPVSAFISGTRDFFFNMPTAVKTLNQSELLKARGFSQEVEIARMGKVFDNKFVNKLRKKQDKMIDYMLMATKVGDRIPIYVGGWAVYSHVLKKTGSKVRAMEAFNRVTAKTQQSTDPDQLSLAQKTNPMLRGLTMFMSAPMAQFRGEARAIRQLMKGEINNRQFAKNILIYHFILPGLYQAVANGIIFGEWDKDDQIRAAILGSFNGIPILGDIFNATFRRIQGKESRGIEILKWTKPLVDMAGDLFDSFEAGTEGDFEELTQAIMDAFKNSGALTGLPAPQIDNIKRGFEELEDGDLKSSTLRFLGWPDSVIRNIE